jgi:predicted O-methyltransferase YrrM
MAIMFHPSVAAVEEALANLKKDGLVHPDAVFNSEAPDGLRSEVTYRDVYFAYRLGRTEREVEVVDEAIALLKSAGLVDGSADYDRETCSEWRDTIKPGFEGTWTSLSPTMERLLYMLTSVRRPRHLIEFGSFWGYTLAWFAGPCLGSRRANEPQRIIGIDVDADMTERARQNFAKVEHGAGVKLIAEDARTALTRLPDPFDFVYIEAKCESAGRSSREECLYLTFLKQVYDRLPEGAWGAAHDNLDWSFRQEVAEYLSFVRDRSHFSESICFDIDNCGLELPVNQRSPGQEEEPS